MSGSPSFENEFLKQDNDTADNWTWPHTDESTWEAVTDKHKQFSDQWYGQSTDSITHSKFPYVASLGPVDGKCILPFSPDGTSGNRILVIKSYEDIYLRILRLREVDEGDDKGAVITGQPGSGKTTFLNFVLARLLSARQVVLLCTSKDIHLFYRGKVYYRPMASSFGHLPERLGPKYYPIWTLIDVDFNKEESVIPEGSNLWPIQASPPNSSRWKVWQNHFGAAVWGMPLWNMEELIQGLPLRRQYKGFRSGLKGPLLRSTTERIDAALKILRAETGAVEILRAETGAVEMVEVVEEGRDEMGDCIEASVADQDETMTEAGQLQAPVANTLKMDDALKILVRNATQEFGFAPRDVYRGVLNLTETKAKHNSEVKKLDYSKLKTLFDAFSDKGELSASSHHVVAISPFKGTLKVDDWIIHFKSPRIARQTMVLMRLEEDKYLRKIMDMVRKAPEGAVMAGWIFETIVHRMLSLGWQLDAGSTPEPILMISDNDNPPTFSTPSKSPTDTEPTPRPIRTIFSGPKRPTLSTDSSSLSPSTPNTSLSFPKPRGVTLVDFPELSDVTLEENTYYMPSASNHPLFDSFIIEYEDDKKTLVLSVFQITISTTHGGSANGLPIIRDIMKHLKDLDPNAEVKVRYFLVCCDKGDETISEWKMPTSWNEKSKLNDHRGDVFYIRVSPSDRYGLY